MIAATEAASLFLTSALLLSVGAASSAVHLSPLITTRRRLARAVQNLGRATAHLIAATLNYITNTSNVHNTGGFRRHMVGQAPHEAVWVECVAETERQGEREKQAARTIQTGAGRQCTEVYVQAGSAPCQHGHAGGNHCSAQARACST